MLEWLACAHDASGRCLYTHLISSSPKQHLGSVGALLVVIALTNMSTNLFGWRGQLSAAFSVLAALVGAALILIDIQRRRSNPDQTP